MGQDPVPGPDTGSFKVVQACTIPPVASFEGADPGFAAGAALDGSAERAASFVGLAGLAVLALAWDDHGAYAELAQLLVDFGFAVAAVGGHRARAPSSA